MAQQTTSTGFGGAEGRMEDTVNAINATSKNMQAIAGECFDISKQAFEHATQTLDKLRNARGMEEIAAIQTNYVKEVFENATQHARKFSELIAVFPGEITKPYQDAWLKSVHATVEATQAASQTATESARKSSSVFEKSA